MKKTLTIVSILLFGLQNISNAKIYQHKSCNCYFFSNFIAIDRKIISEAESIEQEISNIQEELIQLFNAHQKAFSKKNKKKDNRKKVVYKIKIYSQEKKPKNTSEPITKNTPSKNPSQISQNIKSDKIKSDGKKLIQNDFNIQNKKEADQIKINLENDLLIDIK